MTPARYRENPVILMRVQKPNLGLHYAMVDERMPLISEGIVLEFHRRTVQKPVSFMGARAFIPIEEQMPPGENTGVDLMGEAWKKVEELCPDIPRKKGGVRLDVCYTDGAPEGCLAFFAGYEVEEGAAPDGAELLQLPAREYIVCGFEAADFEQLVTDAIYKAWNYSGLWLEHHGLEIDMDAYSPEVYYDTASDGAYMDLWIAVRENHRRNDRKGTVH